MFVVLPLMTVSVLLFPAEQESSADAWCAARCEELFAPDAEAPACEKDLIEHSVRGGKIVETVVADEPCRDRHRAWNVKLVNRKKARRALGNVDGCRLWCADTMALRKGEPLPSEAQELEDILTGVELCILTESDADDIGLFRIPVECRGMLFVAAGKFMMGANRNVEDAQEREKPLHVVELDAYFMDRHEVTVAAFRRCFEAGACRVPEMRGKLKYFNWGYPERETHPINGVDWSQADAYCRWSGKRLCTEAEWEKGARGRDARNFPWGNESPSAHLVVMDDGLDPEDSGRPWPVLSYTQTVCSHPAGNSPYGLCDMAGNVWEWVADWYDEDYYKSSPTQNPMGPSNGQFKVIRSGRFSHIGYYLRVSSRGHLSPKSRFPYLGFRCCMDAVPEAGGRRSEVGGTRISSASASRYAARVIP